MPPSHAFNIATLCLEVAFCVMSIGTYVTGTWMFISRASSQERRRRGSVIMLLANTAMVILAVSVRYPFYSYCSI